MASSSTSTTILTLHPDVFYTQILARLDAQSLAAMASTSSHLRSLSNHQQLWRDISNSTWPSTNNPPLQAVISTFPTGHRSFFSDSFPALDCFQVPPSKILDCCPVPITTTGLISAVDIYYKNDPIFSRAVETDTVTGWFEFPPFRIDLLDVNEIVPTQVEFEAEGEFMIKNLEENLTLSWIMIDSGRKRAVNLTSRWPVSVQQHWLTRDVHVKYSVIIRGSGDDRRWGWFSMTEFVECEVMVTLGGKEGGEMYVREVTMQMKDMDERNLNGRDSLEVLQRAMENEKRKRGRREDGKERYRGFLVMKKERKERNQRREKVLNVVSLVTCLIISVAFWSYKLFRLIEDT